MNQNDISAILPTDTQLHYIPSSQIMSHSPTQHPALHDDYTVVSHQFPLLFYCKRSMKSLLEERSLVCEFMKLKFKSVKKMDAHIPVEEMYLIVADLFKESPTVFDPLHFVFVHDCGVAYGFFSGDAKFVPMCKKCNFSVHVVIRTNSIKIICCNPKCKIKILGQCPIHGNNHKQKQQKPSSKPSREQIQKTEQSKQTEKDKDNQRTLTKQQFQKIQKTAKKIAYS